MLIDSIKASSAFHVALLAQEDGRMGRKNVPVMKYYFGMKMMAALSPAMIYSAISYEEKEVYVMSRSRHRIGRPAPKTP